MQDQASAVCILGEGRYLLLGIGQGVIWPGGLRLSQITLMVQASDQGCCICQSLQVRALCSEEGARADVCQAISERLSSRVSWAPCDLSLDMFYVLCASGKAVTLFNGCL